MRWPTGRSPSPSSTRCCGRGWETRHQTTRAGLTAFLRREPTAREVDETYVVMGPEAYRTLVEERGWTDEEYTDWVADALARLLHIDLSGPTEEAPHDHHGEVPATPRTTWTGPPTPG